jgi:hypothetical protein
MIFSDVLSILTLGDGDFTYSLDLATYLSRSAPPNIEYKGIRFIASGIDSHAEVLDKYRDSPFVLGKLADFSSSHLDISVQHGVNAILTARPPEPPEAIGKIDHVMFHHPHLGTEDALLHSRFLYHFFHSCVHGWMKVSLSFLHLTLVAGQCERWKCLEAAASQGLVLLQRTPFVPPPVENAYYHYRRHQTGKSFVSRTSGSETLIFGRDGNPTSIQLLSRGIFSWSLTTTIKTDGKIQGEPKIKPISCPHCDREFKEERSLRCHIRDRHPDGPEKRSKQTSVLDCVHCRMESGGVRSFETEKALKDHQRAKHLALHKEIYPDWCKTVDNGEGKNEGDNNDNAKKCTCSICGAVFDNREGETAHLEDFRPSSTTELYNCAFCGKSFREARARLQHENFCNP